MFHTLQGRDPLEESSFGPLSRDLASLVLLRIDKLAFLLSLKSVSRATANAVRRAVHSDGGDGEMGVADPCGHLFDTLWECDLSFPVKVHFDKHWNDGLVNIPDEPDCKEMTVHEFHLEFRLGNKLITDPEVIMEWIFGCNEYNGDSKVLDNSQGERAAREHVTAMFVTATRFCVEWPGVGIFHSVEEFWDALKIDDHVKKEYELKKTDWFTCDGWVASGCQHEIEIASLTRLHLLALNLLFL